MAERRLGLTRFIARVKGPTRPTTMATQISDLENVDSSGVIPVERPTMARAEVASNKISVNGIASAKFRIKAKINRHREAITVIAKAWKTKDGCNLLPNTSTSSRPRI